MRFASTSALLLLVSACAGGSPPRGDGGNSCTTDNDCNDGHDCTLDACGVDMTCRYTAVNERCTGGQVCEVGRGCVTSAECTMDTDCMDAHDCTIDTCVVGGVCNHTAIDERCTAPETCDPTMGCVGPMGCTGSGDCNDDIACTIDTCAADMTCRNTPEDSLCTGTGEVCSATSGCFVPRPCTIDMDCDDGNFCNGREFCITEFGCQPPPAPASCADTNACTLNERCDTTMDMCVSDCDPGNPACGCTPAGPTCSGTFTLTPAPSDNCAFGMVFYNLGQVTFTNTSGFISAMPSQASFESLSDTSGTACPSFRAVTSVSGECTETYVLQGTFTDDDHFTGMWTATYTGAGCTIFGSPICNDRTLAVTGTRM